MGPRDVHKLLCLGSGTIGLGKLTQIAKMTQTGNPKNIILHILAKNFTVNPTEFTLKFTNFFLLTKPDLSSAFFNFRSSSCALDKLGSGFDSNLC